MFSLQQSQKTRGQDRFCLVREREVSKIMYTHVSKYENDKIKIIYQLL
jgi:hypothetical protein